MSRAQRRADNARIKAKFRRIARDVLHSRTLPQDKKWVGKTSAVHLTCDCGWCKWPDAGHSHPGFEKRNPTEVFL